MAKKRIPDLVVERAEDRGNFMYLSVLAFRKENYLVIIDNITEDTVSAYVLDFAQQEGINLKQLMPIITSWFYRASYKYPLSFEFSRLGISNSTNRIYRNFDLGHVMRLVGNDFRYDITAAPKIKRRRVSLIPAGVEIKLKRSSTIQRVEVAELTD